MQGLLRKTYDREIHTTLCKNQDSMEYASKEKKGDIEILEPKR
jgi:hypothetical protein